MSNYAKWKKEIKSIETDLAKTKWLLEVLSIYGEFANQREKEILDQGKHEVRMLNNLLDHLRESAPMPPRLMVSKRKTFREDNKMMPYIFSDDFIDTKWKTFIMAWTNHIEEGAYKQAVNLARHPCTFHHVALMPDVHQGYGMPIGGVVAFKDAVSPNCVGVDIGCGMGAVQADIRIEDMTKEKLIDIRERRANALLVRPELKFPQARCIDKQRA